MGRRRGETLAIEASKFIGEIGDEDCLILDP